MSTITSPGIGSGLDVKGIVEQLMSSERKPLEALTKRGEEITTQISAYGKLKSALSTFRKTMRSFDNPLDFQIYSAKSSNEAAFTATARSTASPSQGEYAVNVTSLARQDRYMSGKQSSSYNALGISGDLKINGQTIALADTDNLYSIRDKINAYDFFGQSSQSNPVPEVKASVIDNTLVLESKYTGVPNALTIDESGLTKGVDASGNPIAAPLGLTQTQTPKNSVLTLNGVTITRYSNDISSALDGVNLQLTSEGSGTLTVAQDKTAIGDKVQAFADAYNTLRDAIEEAKTGDLKGDRTMLSLERQLFGVASSAGVSSNAFSHLSEIGLSVQRDGTMKLDEAALSKALDADTDAVGKLFAKDDEGFANRYYSFADSATFYNGLVDGRQTGLMRNLDDNLKQQTRMTDRLNSVETRYFKEFSSLDKLVSQMTQTGNFLSQQLGSLSGTTGN